MTAFKCKMCGASLEVPEGATSVTCDYCRTQQTLPRLDDDRRANLYDRGNHFRRASEYDKAMRIFEQVLSEDANDAEAYWSIVLCRYGVEYVEDPATGRRMPTVNRMQASSILADEDYRQALAHADLVQRGIYEQQAKEIAAIQEGIAEVAAKEEPFDVFICYKETDAQGQRTRDSVLANDLYHELTREGFRVFFARITLEDKLGQAYEPYIYSALQSSKAMVVIGTKPEYVMAPWVKNEWSRYLALIKAGARKTLIPAYRDMDPYDLPEEFSHLQAQDMSKLGFMQDLVRGIKKICGEDERSAQVSQVATAPAQVVMNGTMGTASSLLKRANIFLADGEWGRASEYAERVLDIDPENAEAYLVKVMVELEVKDRAELGAKGIEFLRADDYEKVAKYAKGEFVKEHARIRYEALKTQFDIACEYAEKARDLPAAEAGERWKEIAGEFEWAEEYPGATERVQECRKRAVEAEQAIHFNNAGALVEEAQSSDAGVAAEVWEHAAQEFELAAEHPQAQEHAQECRKRIEQASQFKTACDLVKEAEACRLVGAREAWERAAQAFDSAGDYPQAQERAQQCYERAAQAVRNLDEANCRVEEASELAKKNQERFEAKGVDRDGAIQSEFYRIRQSIYDLDELAAAKKVFEVCTDGARKANDSRLAEQQLQAARKKKRNLLIGVCIVVAIAAVAAAYLFVIRPAIITSQAEEFVAAGDYESAIGLYEKNDRPEDADAVRLDWAKALETAGDYEQAARLYEELGMSDEEKACLSSAFVSLKVGDTAVFGSYEQDGNVENGAEAIEWVALAKQGNKTLLVSKYALDFQPYNISRTDVTWKNCTLRIWLNESFLSMAFTEDERSFIDDTDVANSDNGEYGTQGGNPTVDKVFLLSIDEAENHFSSNEDRVCTTTAHAKNQGAWTGSNGECRWWLRSPGGDSDYAAVVSSGGSVNALGWGVGDGNVAVRPALWINP